MTQYENNRTIEIRAIHSHFTDFYKICGGILLVLIGIWIGSLVFSDGYATNVYTEMLSIFVTILVLDRLNEWRSTQQLKHQLIREAGSRDNSTALNAIDWLRAENWLTVNDSDALLIGKKLSRANLEQAYLYESNLYDTNLYKANLSHADLSKADMRDAFLHRATLENTSLYNTDFRRAILWGANLRGASYIDMARFDERTVLPDAVPLKDDEDNHLFDEKHHIMFDKYWIPETDMTRYTDPQHANFWQPEWVQDAEA